jgi:CHASE2 domain-containing sensor protein
VLPVTRAAPPLATSLASEAAALGHTQMPVDADGVVRRFYAQEGKAGQLWWHMALSLHCVGQTTRPCQPSAPPPADSVAANSWQKLQPQFIAFARASRDRQNSLGSPFTTYSYIDILRGNIPAVAFRGKYVLIGATAAGLGEKFTAPIGFDARLISNVEMLGHVLNGIQDTHLEPASATLNRSLNVLPVLLGLLALAWLGPSGGLISSILLALLSLSIAGLAPRWGHVQTAPAAALLSLSLAYPLWSWLRLRAATRFLALELRDLQGQGLPAPSLKSDASISGSTLWSKPRASCAHCIISSAKACASCPRPLLSATAKGCCCLPTRPRTAISKAWSTNSSKATIWSPCSTA